MKTFKLQKPTKAPEPRGDVEVGDHLYVHHGGQPCTGRVICHGAHGVTVEVDGKHQRVKWGKVLGHKQRVPQRYSIVDHGEDGMLVEDAQGRRRFIGTPNESKDDPMIAKSLSRRPVLLFTKAEGAPPGAGLTKKVITDKNGVQTTRWVKVDKGGPPAQRGQHVGFENGEHRGHGEVAAAGRDGVTVRDPKGGDHRVPHDKITHHWGGDGAPDASPHDQADAGGERQMRAPHNGAEDIARALFDTSELERLAEKVPQPVQSWEDLETKGKEGLEQFKDMLGKVAQSLGLETGKRPQSFDHAVNSENEKAKSEGRAPKSLDEADYMLPDHWDNDKGFLFMGPLKGKDRAEEKVRTDYKGDWSQLRDMVRATIAVPGLAQIPKVLSELKAQGIHLAQKPKNNLVKPLPGGYRDLNMIVKLPNGLLAELQVHVKPMTLAKEKGHKDYETTRSIEAKYKEKGLEKDKSKWSDEDRDAHAAAMAKQEKTYGDAWDRATKHDQSNLTKSMHGPIMVLLNLKGF